MRSREPLIEWVARFWYLVIPVAVALGIFIDWAAESLGPTFGTMSVLSDDPWTYLERWEEIRSGDTPYTDMTFEHLPLTLLMLVLAGVVADFFDIRYVTVFTSITAVLAFGTAYAVYRIGLNLGDRRAVARLIILMTPLLPLVLFRTDLVPVMFAAFAMLAWISGRGSQGTASAMAGILAKGWPVLLAVSEWWRGRRVRAVVLSVFCLGLAVFLMLLPGFQSGRAFSGIHQETVLGSLMLFWRHVTGADLGIIYEAGAIYLKASSWELVANLAIGAVLGLWALTGMRRSNFNWRGAHVLASALTLSLVVGSPLLSPQFLVWPVAFLALVAGRRVLILSTAVSGLTIFLIGFWANEAAWWSALLVVRNVMLVALAFVVARSAAMGHRHLDWAPIEESRPLEPAGVGD